MAAADSYHMLEGQTVQEIGQLYPGGKPLGFSTSAKVDLFPTIVFFFSTFIMIAGLVTAGEIAWAGWERLQASDASIKKSREDAWRAIRGFVGIVSIGVLLYTFNRDMMRGDLGLERLKISARAGSGGISQVVPKENPILPSNYQARKASHAAVVTRLAPSNIHTNHNDAPCTEAQFGEAKPECTSLAYMPEETIQMILKLNASCHCTLVITGGTEPGHLSHGENKRPVDLRLTGPRGDPNNTDPLYVYVKSLAGNKLGSSDTCFERYVLFGFQFCDEKPPNPQHFHAN